MSEYMIVDAITQVLVEAVQYLRQRDKVLVMMQSADGAEYPSMDVPWVRKHLVNVHYTWWIGSLSVADAMTLWSSTSTDTQLPIADDPGDATRVILVLDGQPSTLAWVTL